MPGPVQFLPMDWPKHLKAYRLGVLLGAWKNEPFSKPWY